MNALIFTISTASETIICGHSFNNHCPSCLVSRLQDLQAQTEVNSSWRCDLLELNLRHDGFFLEVLKTHWWCDCGDTSTLWLTSDTSSDSTFVLATDPTQCNSTDAIALIPMQRYSLTHWTPFWILRIDFGPAEWAIPSVQNSWNRSPSTPLGLLRRSTTHEPTSQDDKSLHSAVVWQVVRPVPFSTASLCFAKLTPASQHWVHNLLGGCAPQTPCFFFSFLSYDCLIFFLSFCWLCHMI